VSSDCMAEVAQTLDVLVDERVLLEVGVGARMYPRAGSSRSRTRSNSTALLEELLNSDANCAARSVVGHTSVGRWNLLDDVGHGEGLAEPYAEQRLVFSRP